MNHDGMTAAYSWSSQARGAIPSRGGRDLSKASFSMACIKEWATLIVVALLCSCSLCLAGTPERKVYIVYMGNPDSSPERMTLTHKKMLTKALKSTTAASRAMVYSYTASLKGFAAILSVEEAASISRMSGVISVFPSLLKKLHTTRSWDFLGINVNDSRSVPTSGSDVIIGVLDTGVWPESQSFSDKNVPDPIPSKWKGECVSGDEFNSSNCNRKLIGARMYLKAFESQFGPIQGTGEFRSPRDAEGHGSHTASTAGGDLVEDASLFGLAEGTARGATPTARIAVYKVCWFGSCTDADILAAFDEAVTDGVDLISFSIGGVPVDYFQDSISIGSFHAIQNGVFVSCSAGNDGPFQYTATNLAPWLTTVAASSMDRKFISTIMLGNNLTVKGTALNTLPLSNPWYPLVAGNDVSDQSSPLQEYAKYCLNGTLDVDKVRGKIVLCYGGFRGSILYVLEAGGAGVIVVSEFAYFVGYVYSLPASAVESSDAEQIVAYINSTSSPIANIMPSITVVNDGFASTTAMFSSRGPNYITPDILKPDITAPGVDILAAWSPAMSISENSWDNRTSSYNIISGTSMSCPHVTGAAAFVKYFHPDWSPAAIKSALMTTATPLQGENNTNTDGPLNYGSGEISPLKATDPGLVYDIDATDYTLFLCSISYTSEQIQLVSGVNNFSCPQENPPSVHDLNYPSIAIANVNGSLNTTISRTFTNVGSSPSTYTVQIQAPDNVNVAVFPSSLQFDNVNDRKSFSANFQASSLASGEYVSGSLTWTDGVHVVRTPIIIWAYSSTSD
ncbi:hypothetical protein O6H91_21G033600 [Diphasiastrum complanatum]|uniref:Uncharacterized protein n=2 Tax=Diphasiastrum complanatum TaxID=34168 RepID=A0ACC2AJK2_DIPCM|nr:hypothetical protein O6H91_21G033600 [Diphasiastrum complanatum]